MEETLAENFKIPLISPGPLFQTVQISVHYGVTVLLSGLRLQRSCNYSALPVLSISERGLLGQDTCHI